MLNLSTSAVSTRLPKPTSTLLDVALPDVWDVKNDSNRCCALTAAVMASDSCRTKSTTILANSISSSVTVAEGLAPLVVADELSDEDAVAEAVGSADPLTLATVEASLT